MDKVTIKIPRPLYEKIRQVIDGTGFASPTDFVVTVLRDLVSDRLAAPRKGRKADALTAAEVAAVRRRLRSLGYL